MAGAMQVLENITRWLRMEEVAQEAGGIQEPRVMKEQTEERTKLYGRRMRR